MITFTNEIDILLRNAPKPELEWTGTPQIRFSIAQDAIVKVGDRIKMGNVVQLASLNGSNIVTVYYELTEIISIGPNPQLVTTQNVVANAKRITV